MKNIVVRIMDKIEERKEREREYQELMARIRARKAREAYFDQILQERAERLRQGLREHTRKEIQNMIERKLQESQQA